MNSLVDNIETTFPATVRVVLSEPTNRFDVYNEKSRLEYFRYLGGGVSRFKFNVPKEGRYSFSQPVSLGKISPIEVDPRVLSLKLPPAERDRWKNVDIEYNPNLLDTPAANWTDLGHIEVNEQFVMFPAPIRLFILLHEAGHFFYLTEKYCDLYAYVNFLRMGHNRSMAYYALDKVLHRSDENIERMEYLLSAIRDTTGEFEPN